MRRIAYLKQRYQLGWLVDQATFDVASVSVLEDCDLIRLLCDMERALECILDGVPFEDADLVRPVASSTKREPKWTRQQIAQAEAASIGLSKMKGLSETKAGEAEPPF